MLKLKLSNKIKNYWDHPMEYTSMKDTNKFLDYFFGFSKSQIIINNKYNAAVYDIQEADQIFEKNKINIMICVENCNFWKHYKHFNKYGNFGNKDISIYIYNHFSEFIQTENYIVIPVIYSRINYFLRFYKIISPKIYTTFENKKFCLVTCSPKGKPEYVKKIINIFNQLQTIGDCDHLNMYKNIIKNKSCYHDQSLLNIFNRYKFIFCFENSITNGYITEKIFNAFFARSIPIYSGPKNKQQYFNKNAFIDVDEKNFINKIQFIKNKKSFYLKLINYKKINPLYNDQDYINKTQTFIKNKLSKI